MNHDTTHSSPEEGQLQELFDETAAHPSEAQLARMIARAEQIPGGHHKRRGSVVLLPLAVAAGLALVVGGFWFARRDDTPAVASTAIAVPSAPTAFVSAEPQPDVHEDPTLEDLYDDGRFLPADPLAVLDGDWEDNGGVWMSELDLLHAPLGQNDDAYWAEMDQLLEEGG